MTAVCALALLLAVWIGQAALRAPNPAVGAFGGAGAALIAVAAVAVWRHCHTNPPPPLASIQETNR